MITKRLYGFSVIAFLLFVVTSLVSYQYTTFATTPVPSTSPTPSITPIPLTGVIVGNVVDAETLDGIADATVSTDTGDYSATTGPDGSFFLEVPEGTYLLIASAENYIPSSQPVTVTAGAPTQVAFPLQPDVTSGSGAYVYGFVVDIDENELIGVSVTIEGESYSGNVETDEDGWFEFANVPVGEYIVTFEMDGYQTVTQNIVVPPGETEVDLDMITMEVEVIASISGSVLDAHGIAIESARVKIRGLRTKFSETKYTDEDGFFEFTDLEADTYLIIAKAKGYRRAKQKAKLKNGEQKEVNITLKKIRLAR